jgi:hypothetical protein
LISSLRGTGLCKNPAQSRPSSISNGSPWSKRTRRQKAALVVACDEKCRLEELGYWGADGGTEAAHDAEWSALANVVECVPATVAGVIASLTYIRGLVEGGYGRIEDDLIVVFLANVAEALSEVASWTCSWLT